jgi:hypothetical protein
MLLVIDASGDASGDAFGDDFNLKLFDNAF